MRIRYKRIPIKYSNYTVSFPTLLTTTTTSGQFVCAKTLNTNIKSISNPSCWTYLEWFFFGNFFEILWNFLKFFFWNFIAYHFCRCRSCCSGCWCCYDKYTLAINFLEAIHTNTVAIDKFRVHYTLTFLRLQWKHCQSLQFRCPGRFLNHPKKAILNSENLKSEQFTKSRKMSITFASTTESIG